MSLDVAQVTADAQTSTGGVNTLPADQRQDDTQRPLVGGNTLDGGRCAHDAQHTVAPVNTLTPGHTIRAAQSKAAGVILPAARPAATPIPYAPSADLPPGQALRAPQTRPAGGDLPADQCCLDAQKENVGGSILPAATAGATPRLSAPLADPLTDGHPEPDTQKTPVVGNPHDALLLILADALDDLERTRISTQNRLRSLIAVPANPHDSAKRFANDGVRDLILAALKHANPKKWESLCAELRDTDADRVVVQLVDVTSGLITLEHRSTLELAFAMRAHPLGPWVKRTVGIGEKQGARLLAAIGDPAARAMPSQLWQYCGHGAPSKRQRGVKSWWNPTAKMRVHLIAESCIKQRTSPYRAVYDEARMDWAARDTSDGHKHNHALRMVGKAILLDLWREAKEIA